MLYFAYGSNLNHFQMKRRCKDSIFLKKINLRNFTLTFRSKYRAADIEPKKNSIVQGALFEISKSDEKKVYKSTTREYDGKILVFYTKSGKILECTPEHLLPVNRNGTRLLIKANKVLDTDKLFSV